MRQLTLTILRKSLDLDPRCGRNEWSWLHASIVRSVLCLGLLFAAVSASAQNLGSLHAGSPQSEPALLLASLGNDGDLLDHYVSVVTSTLGSSAHALVLRSAIVARCADDDGCIVRMSHIDLDSGERQTAPPVGFTVDPNGEEWTLRDTFYSLTRGTNGDNSPTIIHTTAGGRCQFLDDYFLVSFKLTADPAPGETQSFRCSVVIDD